MANTSVFPLSKMRMRGVFTAQLLTALQAHHGVAGAFVRIATK
ncbi:hypothetical protein [Synechococcus sp.]